MTIKIEYRRLGIGKYLEIDEDRWYSEVFGVLNWRKDGDLGPDSLKSLEEEAEALEYDESAEEGFFDNFLKKFYGGSIETSSGRRDWIGSIPSDVKKYIEDVEDSIK